MLPSMPLADVCPNFGCQFMKIRQNHGIYLLAAADLETTVPTKSSPGIRLSVYMVRDSIDR